MMKVAVVGCGAVGSFYGAKLARARWEKLVWNIPFNGLGVASAAGWEAVRAGVIGRGAVRGCCLTTDRLLGEERWEGLVMELMREVSEGAGALGHEVSDRLAAKLVARTRTMGAYKPSTVIDFERGQPLELESIFIEPLRRAEAAGARLPRLAALCRVLEQMSQGAPLP